jgi:hypothetical protein
MAEEGRGKNKVVQPANLAANAAANAPATLRLMLQQTPRPMLMAMPPTMQPTLPTFRTMPPQIQDAM